MVIAPAGAPITESSELLASPKMRQLVRELKTRYASRLIIFDLPPLLSSDDTLAFAPYVDAVLLVIEEGKTTQDEFASTIALLQSANQNLIGTVLNKAAETNLHYGYY